MTQLAGKAMDRQKFLFGPGRLFSPLYALAMRLRVLLYNSGLLRRHSLGVPVISIGNLTWGGTGKTPAVIALTRMALGLGFRPLILSRGYGGASTAPVNVVSDGNQVLMKAAQAGDEPVHLAEALSGVPVLTGRKRVLPGRYAVSRFKPDLILLDDGFQHLALERELDIVLLSCREPFGNGRVFPGGQLREPLDALARASCFVITGCSEETENLRRELTGRLQSLFPAVPVFSSSFALTSLYDHRSGASLSLSALLGKRVTAFCGLARPESFRRALEKTGLTVAGFKAFDDHHAYGPRDVVVLEGQCAASQAETLLTTEKDYVKIRSLQWSAPLAVARGTTVFDADCHRFLEERLRQLVARKATVGDEAG